MTSELRVLLAGVEIGEVRRTRQGTLTLVYDERWRHADDAYPLSLSMPLAARTHGHATIEAFLWGLLPDNTAVLERWGRHFHVSPRNPFALIAHVGEDCAGAVQLVPPERVPALVSSTRREVAWLTESDVAERLRILRGDHAAWRLARDTGQFSLAGAQPKTALLFERGRWGIPSGRTPTTHILKPPTGAFHGHVENEHVCLELARALGLPTVDSRVRRFDDEVAIVLERYDRLRTPAGWIRVHQEDMCQALAIPPQRQYQNEGGPGARAIVELLRTHSTSPAPDIDTFLDALIFNWLIAGTDGHAKNYALLHAPGRVRLSPLYDIASALPYSELDQRRLKLAMSVGDKYRLDSVGPRQWTKLAAAVHVDANALVTRIRGLGAALPAAAAAVATRTAADGLSHVVVGRLTDACARRAEKSLAALRPAT
jgi:serine/threonine-protein kinase HipA